MPQRKNASKSSSAEEARHMDQWRRNSGAKRGAPEGNTNGMRHGIYSNRFLSDEEKPMFESIIAQLYRDFVFTFRRTLGSTLFPARPLFSSRRGC